MAVLLAACIACLCADAMLLVVGGVGGQEVRLLHSSFEPQKVTKKVTSPALAFLAIQSPSLRVAVWLLGCLDCLRLGEGATGYHEACSQHSASHLLSKEPLFAQDLH